eukprot:CAMPEP_0174886258 /NCGR_PEP_ID=MMETSP0167-20121228/1527_1 /TAXON_ID=38298 /ORGANISM="Rhodella maculata, Strain CCMP736" /LENGTH=175 /DNA_ID=CAMNT_0016122191 /DNA_START=164 /DNA_END=692 /DNA_ORIENTATION=-
MMKTSFARHSARATFLENFTLHLELLRHGFRNVFQHLPAPHPPPRQSRNINHPQEKRKQQKKYLSSATHCAEIMRDARGAGSAMRGYPRLNVTSSSSSSSSSPDQHSSKPSPAFGAGKSSARAVDREWTGRASFSEGQQRDGADEQSTAFWLERQDHDNPQEEPLKQLFGHASGP